MRAIHITQCVRILIETSDGPAEYNIPINSQTNFVWSNPSGMKVQRISIVGFHTEQELSEEEKARYEYED